ncbi:16S rRNA (cytidine(1402)-2'-O)-methyltransferase [Calderihabitans maritimus]|uniref:Ribosomal RNA small subunit methyltransferase I n=1 Tax=Calderihabitans maritimus TaxID=1246530 RepID=A0A1Z5HQ08_9FIRM|nr:16S rRNA (cytidine(1402)-2'-O)-methyltransferase [Calderihabitans maritimus]GAW91619.1 methyltransferase [Calderihabitans maritimus]
MAERQTGTLYLVGTPIGNLEDITHRALNVLRHVEVVAAEDTRHTRKLLSHYNIHVSLTSYHEHNRETKGDYLLKLLQKGFDVALVSDAGMPGISDPGYSLVVKAIEAGIPVVPVPGPNALIAGLVVSGLPTRRFAFEGFLPHDGKARRRRLKALAGEERTMVFYESPHRLLETLKDMREILGPRPAAVARELTKKFEEVVRGDLDKLIQYFSDNRPKGEITLVVGGAEGRREEISPSREEIIHAVEGLVEKGMPKKEAIKKVAEDFAVPKREVYRAVVESRKD